MTLTELIFDLERFRQNPQVEEKLASEFSESEYVRLPRFLTTTGLSLFQAEVERMSSIAKRRDFFMTCMDDSPRHMRTIGGRGIVDTSSLLPLAYAAPELTEFISIVFGEPVALVDDPTERHVINILDGPGDTHGAHFDDFPIALVMFLRTPSAGMGGEVELVAGARSLSELNNGAVRREGHAPGDAYLLKADTAAHRVSPLTGPGSRVAINMAFGRPGATTTTESASLLYD